MYLVDLECMIVTALRLSSVQRVLAPAEHFDTFEQVTCTHHLITRQLDVSYPLAAPSEWVCYDVHPT
jgi:hypothetical protein